MAGTVSTGTIAWVGGRRVRGVRVTSLTGFAGAGFAACLPADGFRTAWRATCLTWTCFVGALFDSVVFDRVFSAKAFFTGAFFAATAFLATGLLAGTDFRLVDFVGFAFVWAVRALAAAILPVLARAGLANAAFGRATLTSPFMVRAGRRAFAAIFETAFALGFAMG